MLNAILEALLLDASARDIAEIFLWLLIITLAVAVVASRFGRATRFVSYAPTLLTSLGILGTFVGIVVGLMDFDAADIDGSIQGLLEGLKTAFITSLAGMGGAIVFRILASTPLLNPPQKVTVEVTGTGPEDILKALNLQSKLLHRMQIMIGGDKEASLVGQIKLGRSDANDRHKEIVKSVDQGTELLTRIQALLGAEEESSIVGQIKLLRSDAGDHHKATLQAAEQDRQNLESFAEHLWKELDAFAEMMSKSATEQVINALKEVIADFNKNLTEQFGENFKALDASVQRLVEWQENYRVQLEQMGEQYAQGVRAITQTESSVAHISEETKQIPTTMGELKSVMEVNQHQLAELERHLDAFREMRDKAVEAVPEIRQQVQATIDTVSDSVKAAGDHYQELLDLSDAYIKAHDEKNNELLDRFIQNTDAGIAKVREGLDSGADSVKEAILQGVEEFGQGVQRIQSGLDTTSDNLTQQSDKIREQLEATVTSVGDSTQAASDHYRKLLDLSDDYIEAHDQKTQELLDRFIKTTDAGIAKVQEGLESGADTMKVAILTGAEEFDNSVQRMQANLTNTSDTLATQSEQIREQLEDTVKDINAHVRDMINTLANESKELMSTLKEAGQQTQRDTLETQKLVADSIQQMQTRLENSLDELFRSQMKAMDTAVDGILKEMGRAISTTGDGVNKQLNAIDDAMQQEVNRVMNEMGRALAQITGQFTNDYAKLVQAMGDVVNTSV